MLGCCRVLSGAARARVAPAARPAERSRVRAGGATRRARWGAASEAAKKGVVRWRDAAVEAQRSIIRQGCVQAAVGSVAVRGALCVWRRRRQRAAAAINTRAVCVRVCMYASVTGRGKVRELMRLCASAEALRAGAAMRTTNHTQPWGGCKKPLTDLPDRCVGWA